MHYGLGLTKDEVKDGKSMTYELEFVEMNAYINVIDTPTTFFQLKNWSCLKI